METKIRYDLRLGEGVGLINLEMSRQEIRSIFGEPDSSSQGDLSIKDRYTSIGLHVCYEPDTEICEAIEVLDNVELIYQGGNILGLLWNNMFQWMLENDPNLDIRENGNTFISHSLRIATGPKYNEDLGYEVPETILVFCEGYWPSEEDMKALVKREIDEMPSLEEFAKQNALEKYLQFLEPES